MQDISFTLVWSGEIKNDLVMPNVPVLDDGMIPVKIANNGTVTTVANDDSTWYNYDNKEWANVVLVNEEATADVEGSQSREYYKNNPGTPVLESDILAYYVWIPRYKYKIWSIDATQVTQPQTIDIMFEAKEAVPVYGTTLGSWRTHPAFIWDGNTISGLWVGKFETTGSADIPTILPNEQSLREQDIIDQFKIALKFAGGIMDSETFVVTFSGNDTYALTSETDSHMMKNSEWGAVAYLSHSKYGISQEIYINNSSDCYTGRSGGKVGGSVNTLAVQFSDDTLSTSESYNSTGYYTWIGEPIDSSGVIGTVNDLTLGTKASTTGNVSGIYDMSGGSQEYVMSLYNDLSWNGSGFTLSTLPANKYYNIYSNTIFTGSYTSNIKLCTLDTCGGHALSETASWYSDTKNFGDAYGAWFIRGGSSKSAAGAGIFYTDSLDGGSRDNYSWRSILVVD